MVPRCHVRDCRVPASLPIETAGWHWLDMTLGLGLAGVALNAARRGFVREAGTLLGIAIGVMLAGRMRWRSPASWPQIGALPFLDDAAWLAIVLLSMFLGGGAPGRGWSATRCRCPGIGLADRVFGLAFGVLEGAAGLGLVLLSVRLHLDRDCARRCDGSTLAPILLRWWLVIAASLPPELGVPRHL